ncbi:hypothetical protein COBT_001785, partial [Conglomerata obtusa]
MNFHFFLKLIYHTKNVLAAVLPEKVSIENGVKFDCNLHKHDWSKRYDVFNYSHTNFYYFEDVMYFKAFKYKSDLHSKIKEYLAYTESIHNNFFTVNIEMPKNFDIKKFKEHIQSEQYANYNSEGFGFDTQLVISECTLYIEYILESLQETHNFFIYYKKPKLNENTNPVCEHNNTALPYKHVCRDVDTLKKLNWLIKYLSIYQIDRFLITPDMDILEIPNSDKIKITLSFCCKYELNYEIKMAENVLEIILKRNKMDMYDGFDRVFQIISFLSDNNNKKFIINECQEYFDKTLLHSFLNDYVYFLISKFSQKVICTVINDDWLCSNTHISKIKDKYFDENFIDQDPLKYNFKIRSVLAGIRSEYAYYPKAYHHTGLYYKFDFFVSLKNLVDKFTFCKRMLELLKTERILYTNYLNIYNDWIETEQGKSLETNSFTALKSKIENVSIEAITKCKKIFINLQTPLYIYNSNNIVQFYFDHAEWSLNEMDKENDDSILDNITLVNKLKQGDRFGIVKKNFELIDNLLSLENTNSLTKVLLNCSVSYLEGKLSKMFKVYFRKDIDGLEKDGIKSEADKIKEEIKNYDYEVSYKVAYYIHYQLQY